MRHNVLCVGTIAQLQTLEIWRPLQSLPLPRARSIMSHAQKQHHILLQHTTVRRFTRLGLRRRRGGEWAFGGVQLCLPHSEPHATTGSQFTAFPAQMGFGWWVQML